MYFPNLDKVDKLINFRNLSLIKIGNYSFYIGIFFLSSALPISAFFLIISLIASIKSRGRDLIYDKWNYPLYLISFLMLISCLRTSFPKLDTSNINLDLSLVWVDFLKWNILFIIFWGFNIYLKSEKQRFYIAKTLFLSTIPVLISCILQKWFEVYGPFDTLNGLIVWFQRPLGTWNNRVTGLFNNPNYTGIWLAVSLPMIFIFTKNKSKFKSSLSWVLIILTFYLMLQTGSRNAFITFLVSLSFVLPLKMILICIGFIIFLFFLLNISGLNLFYLISSKTFFNTNFFLEKVINPNLFNLSNSVRFELWSNTINLIKQRPFWGWGASTFALIYQLQNKITLVDWEPQHTHSIPLQIAFNYGILVAVILSAAIFFLFFSAYRKIFRENFNGFSITDKMWFLSAFIVTYSNLGDISFFDGKISILNVILVSGLKSCLTSNKKEFE